MALIELINVSKIYDTGSIQVPALRTISLAVEEGEMVAIMGPSGSGKSTLMNILGLLDRPTTGDFILSDEQITLSMSDRKLAKIRSEKIGFVFQSFNLLNHLSALDNVLVPTTYTNIGGKDARLRAESLLESVGLEERMKHRPNELSGGEKQRVAIARALINDPDVLLADEPTGNLDTKTGSEVLGILKQLNREGKTIVIITHDEFIADACERVVYLLDGEVVPANKVQREGGGKNAEPIWKNIVRSVFGALEKL